MKANLIIAILAMATLGLTEQGLVKLACWVILTINFFILTYKIEKRLV